MGNDIKNQTYSNNTNKQKEVFHSYSPEDTFNLGNCIGKELQGGEIILLIGNLGCGKTLFTKGLAHGLGIRNIQEVTSPSFTIIHQHSGRFMLYHVDLYRLSSLDEIYQLGLEDVMKGSNVVAIEWAEKLGPLTPRKVIKVQIQNLGENKRLITLLKG